VKVAPVAPWARERAGDDRAVDCGVEGPPAVWVREVQRASWSGDCERSSVFNRLCNSASSSRPASPPSTGPRAQRHAQCAWAPARPLLLARVTERHVDQRRLRTPRRDAALSVESLSGADPLPVL
jgi:hypothetical protein